MGGARNSQCRSVPYPFQQLTCVQHVHWLCGRNSKCARVGHYFQFFESPSAMSTTLTRLALAPLRLRAAPALAAKVPSYQKRHCSYSCAPPQLNPTVNGEVGVCMTTLSFTFQYFLYHSSDNQSSSHSMHFFMVVTSSPVLIPCTVVVLHGGTLWPVFLFMVVTSSPVPIPCTVVVLVAHCGQCSSL